MPACVFGLTHMMSSLSENECDTCAIEGNLQALNAMFVSAKLLAGGNLMFDVVNANSAFIEQSQ